MIKSVMDYFISTKKYADQKHTCTECGREIGRNEMCMTDGDAILCCKCINDWISRDRELDYSELIGLLEVLGCDACECPDDEEERSQSELDKADTAYMFGV